MIRHLSADKIRSITPRSFLNAAEFEDRGRGTLSTNGRDVIYTDLGTNTVVLTTTWASIREAKLQLGFYRSTFQDVKNRREAFRVIAPPQV